jgi:hypothetical protein
MTRLAKVLSAAAPSTAAFAAPALCAAVLYLLTVGRVGTALAAGLIAGLLGLLGSACADAVRAGLHARRETAEMTAIADALIGGRIYVAPDEPIRMHGSTPVTLYPRHEGTERLHRDMTDDDEPPEK